LNDAPRVSAFIAVVSTLRDYAIGAYFLFTIDCNCTKRSSSLIERCTASEHCGVRDGAFIFQFTDAHAKIGAIGTTGKRCKHQANANEKALFHIRSSSAAAIRFYEWCSIPLALPFKIACARLDRGAIYEAAGPSNLEWHCNHCGVRVRFLFN